MVARDPAHAALAGLSEDNRSDLAYQAAKVAAEGYRATSVSGHHATLFHFPEEGENRRWEAQAIEFREVSSAKSRLDDHAPERVCLVLADG